MQEKVSNYILEKAKSKKNSNKKNILISHNRVLEVQEITNKEIKDGWKLSENENYRILDKDYWKSEELMRLLLEKKKRLPMWLLAILVVIASIFALLVLNVLYKMLTAEAPVKQTIPTPITQPTTPVKTIELKTEEEKENEIEIEKINDNYSDLQIAYNWVNEEYEILQNKYFNLEADFNVVSEKYEEVSEEKQKIDKKLLDCENEEKNIVFNSDKEAFIFYLWQSILKKCDEAIKNENWQFEACKTLYSNYLLNEWKNTRLSDSSN